jgi:hypothetical protein
MKIGDENVLGNQVTVRRGGEKRFSNPMFRLGGGGKFL